MLPPHTIYNYPLNGAKYRKTFTIPPSTLAKGDPSDVFIQLEILTLNINKLTVIKLHLILRTY